VHGFVSQGFLLSSQNNYLARSTHGSFEFSEVGVNVTSQITDKLRAGLQLFARDIGPIGNYNAKFDWYYIDYSIADWLGLRAGRLKLPFGLYNEFLDVDAATVPVLLPQSVYPIQNRDFLLAQTGAEVHGSIDLGLLGGLDYALYGGTIFVERPRNSPLLPLEIVEIRVPYAFGGRLLYETPLEGLRVGGSVQNLRLDTDLVPQGTTDAVTAKIPVTLWVASMEYAAGDWLAALEYSQWHLDSESENPTVVPEISLVHQRGYALCAYRFMSWLQAGAYYSLLHPNMDKMKGRANMQHDVAATLRFDVNPHWLIKIEGHYLRGTAGLDSALNNNTPLDQLARDWFVFLAKTTGYF